MLTDLKIHTSHDGSPGSDRMNKGRGIPLICPQCQQAINLSIGLCGNRQIDAILLQAGRIGTELECDRCGLRFVFHSTGSVAASRSAMFHGREPVKVDAMM
ncbi:hypothetical protein SH668x_002925 [Planctomicrobium sp. SH668]|uniref:hypothetical protein n=1 Tax=Planctomicrobium sp. SH668 TaxID=3448126 RepID=UPI003F5C857A